MTKKKKTTHGKYIWLLYFTKIRVTVMILANIVVLSLLLFYKIALGLDDPLLSDLTGRLGFLLEASRVWWPHMLALWELEILFLCWFFEYKRRYPNRTHYYNYTLVCYLKTALGGKKKKKIFFQFILLTALEQKETALPNGFRKPEAT